ncbi:molybdopterin-binding protein [Nocardioides zeicaulis]
MSPQVRHTPTVITYRVAEAAEILAVSDDTVRRWVEAGRLPSQRSEGRTTVAGTDLAELAEQLVTSGELAERDRTHANAVSARNRMSGIVTRVKRDAVMAQVEMICGPYRVVSLMSSDAADELSLEPGVRAIASVKSTNVVVEVPR